MTERITPQRDRETPGGPPPGSLAGTIGPDADGDPSVIVSSGLYHERLPLANTAVAEIRRRFGDRFDIDPNAVAVIDGEPVDDEAGTRVRSGQLVAFVRPSGEKGTVAAGLVPKRRRKRAPPASPASPASPKCKESVVIEGRTVEARSPEGVAAKIDLRAFLGMLAPARMSTAGLVLPDGIRMIYSGGSRTVLVWEIPPQVHHLKWIASNSTRSFGGVGRSATYAFRRLALPYLVVFAVFTERGGRLVLTGHNEVFFRTAPIESEDDRLAFPALLNISKFPDSIAAQRPLAWICTQYLKLPTLAAEPDLNKRVRVSLRALRHMLLETGFNYSSEHHELVSYWTLSAETIPEIAEIDRWEKLSREDPMFVLSIPWLEATWRDEPMTVRGLADRIFAVADDGPAAPASTSDLARIVFNNGRPSG